MTILEFIRKNSILVIIVIVGVGAGLLMMDYAGKSSAFSRDFYIKVNGTGYSYPETIAMGENGKEFLVSLLHATSELTEDFDTDGDGLYNEQEAAAMKAWEVEHPEIVEFYERLQKIYSAWAYGVTGKTEENMAINRAVLHEEAKALGIHPSEKQIDDYLRTMPPFKQKDGSFNLELYQRLSGMRKGIANRVQEEAFRGVIADMIIWEGLDSLVSDRVSFSSKTELAQVDAFLQSVSGRTAWLPEGAVPPPADPTDEELRAWWEEHKEAYKSEERRVVSVYTLSPGKDSNMENLLTTVDILMQELSLANGQGLDKMLADATNNPEYDPFNYQLEDGSAYRTYELADKETLKEKLSDEVNYNGNDTPLAEVAFAEVTEAPSADAYKAAVENGSQEKLVTIKQIRGPYTTKDDKLKLLRVEAIEAPVVLSFEEARSKALADFRAERAANALKDAAEKLYSEMQNRCAEQGVHAAFALAAEAGAQVENYGPLSLVQLTRPLPSGVSDTDILSTPSGKLTPLVILADGARITSVDKRTVEDSPSLNMQKRINYLPGQNAALRRGMMQDWMNAAYTRYDVQLSEHVLNHANTATEE